MRRIFPILIGLFILGLMEGAVWLVIQSSKDEPASESQTEDQRPGVQPQFEISSSSEEAKPALDSNDPGEAFSPGFSNIDPASFPPPTTEVVNGRTERTIHVGVRRYAWEPFALLAKEGELVRLIVHNADVRHGLVIPDLGVNQDIPEEGAVVEFLASKAGTFEFFCSVWCGEGHMEMRGKITVE